MAPEQTRIQADLRGLVAGDVACDPLAVRMYASDASIYEIEPIGVVRPRSTDDVIKTVGYAAEHGLALFPRGGGSGLAGQSLGRGLILDFSRFMRRAQAPQAGLVRVQCGMVQADLNRMLNAQGLLFGPDPATRSVSSIGSMLSIDAAGSHFPRYGSAGDCVESMQVVLASGEVVELSRHAWAADRQPTTRVEELASQVGVLLQRHSALLMRPPWSEVARGCGYRVEKTLDGDRVDLARLMCGSEGTLGIITEATLRLDTIPEVRGVVLLFFERLDGAAKAALDIAGDDIAACDLMDRRLLEIVRDAEGEYAALLPRGAEAMLLVEMQGSEPVAVRQRLNQLVQRLQRRGRTLISYRLTTDREERDWLWRLARRVIPRLYRLKGSTRALPFIEDIAIPPKRLPEFLIEVQNVLKGQRVTATVFAHAAHGHLDLRPFLDLANREDTDRMERLSEAIYSKVLEYGGSISGEHALGLSRAAFAERQLGPRLELCREVKAIFDPVGILNPGKFLSATPQRVNEFLRAVPTPTIIKMVDDESDLVSGSSLLTMSGSGESSNAPVVDHESTAVASATQSSPGESNAVGSMKQVALPLLLDWTGSESISHATRSCNGCGRCRTSASAERMCPMFRVHKGEEASPRAKANLLRGLLTGHLDPQLFESDELKAVADLCFNCHQCRAECPAAVDIPKMVVEIKAQHVASHGLSLSDRLMNRLDWLAGLGSRFPHLTNWALDNPRMRWLLEKLTGIAQGRKLPRISRRSFLHWAARRKIHRPTKTGGRKVLFFVDQYVNWHNPVLGRALVEVLQHQQIEVYCPTGQSPSYMSMITTGDVGRARKLIKPNIELLADAVRQGYDIVTTEPSAAMCLTQEYRQLLDNEDTRLIAAHTSECCSYLWQMHLQNELELDFRPLNMSVLYHEPCHSRILDARRPALELIKLIPGIQLLDANAGCSGMAGTWGLKQENFRTSLRIGRGLMSAVKETPAQLGITECTACKLQMEQATTKPAVHPVALLAYAYGSMPQLGAWFSSRHEGLVVG
ncbi:MAG: anaerobic glycerol-3-phosphate dehydrogenase subunit C [Pirellulaceae bacterium]|nr:anaerobic glycerol-3-phosphate dehydrogenase subunit C [Pirellulaceae bacterium]